MEEIIKEVVEWLKESGFTVSPLNKEFVRASFANTPIVIVGASEADDLSEEERASQW